MKKLKDIIFETVDFLDDDGKPRLNQVFGFASRCIKTATNDIEKIKLINRAISKMDPNNSTEDQLKKSREVRTKINAVERRFQSLINDFEDIQKIMRGK